LFPLISRGLGMLVPGRAAGRAPQPHAGGQAGQHEQATQAAGGDHGDRAARAGPGQAEPGAEDHGAEDVTAPGRCAREPQRASVPGYPGTAQQR
jgi:hypothetical protein